MKKYQSEQLMVSHQTAEALHRIGAIDDARMREYDEGCLISVAENERDIYMREKRPMLAPAWSSSAGQSEQMRNEE